MLYAILGTTNANKTLYAFTLKPRGASVLLPSLMATRDGFDGVIRDHGKRICVVVDYYITQGGSLIPVVEPTARIPDLPPTDIWVDECQFVECDFAMKLANHAADHTVIVSGLRFDYLGNPFAATEIFLRHAHKIEILLTYCACGRPSNYDVLENTCEDLINANYVPCCSLCRLQPTGSGSA